MSNQREPRDPNRRESSTLRHVFTGLGIASLVIIVAVLIIVAVIAAGLFLLFLACSGH